MKRTHFLVLSGLLIPLMAAGELRTFTNNAGKQIRADLVGMEKGAAVLKLANGRIAKVPLTTLSKEDGDYVKAWWEENKNKAAPGDVRLKIEKNSKRLRESSGDGKGKKNAGKVSKVETSWTCKLENLSTKAIEGITAEYTIYEKVSTRGDSGSETLTEETSNTAEVGALKANGTLEFESDSEISEDSETKRKGVTETRRESIVGIVVTLKVGETEILKQSNPANLLDKLEADAKRKADREK